MTTYIEIAKDIIATFEGCKLEAYHCPAGIWTIGWGNTHHSGLKNSPETLTISQQEADDMLMEDIAYYGWNVDECVHHDLNPCQKAALVSFSYNVGVNAFESSTLLKVINQDPMNERIIHEFSRWVYANGEMLNGLIRRRDAETKLYFTKL